MRKQGAMKERPKDERMNGRINEPTNRLKKRKNIKRFRRKSFTSNFGVVCFFPHVTVVMFPKQDYPGIKNGLVIFGTNHSWKVLDGSAVSELRADTSNLYVARRAATYGIERDDTHAWDTTLKWIFPIFPQNYFAQYCRFKGAISSRRFR